jgi:uncharacterized protein YciI
MNRDCSCCFGVVFIVLLLLVANVGGQTISNPKPDTDPQMMWVFLTKGNSTEGIERSEIEKMQAAHLANFGRLAGLGKLATAGPMADPEKILRGIVVVKANGPDELKEMFEPVLFVKNGFMNADASPMKIQLGLISTKLDAKTLDEFRIAVFSKADTTASEPDSEVCLANAAYCKSIYDDERLRLFVTLDDANSPRRAVLIFKTLDEAVVNELVRDLPSAKNGQWKSSLFPLYLTKGTLDAAK